MRIQTTIPQGGYSNQTAQHYIDLQSPVYLLSDELESATKKFEDGKPTDEISLIKLGPGKRSLAIQVKFTEKPDLPEYLSLVSFENLMACEVNYNVLFQSWPDWKVRWWLNLSPKEDWSNICCKSLNMGLGSVLQSETSYTNSLTLWFVGWIYLYSSCLPASFIIDDNLYQRFS